MGLVLNKRCLATSLALRPGARGDSAWFVFFAEDFFQELTARPPCGENNLLDIDYGLTTESKK
jgi:hypothetical protein